jgi:hypothetical protein
LLVPAFTVAPYIESWPLAAYLAALMFLPMVVWVVFAWWLGRRHWKWLN